MAIRLSHSCFNPRARKGRDIGTRGHFQHGHVSIHAPARGATPLDRLTRQTMPFQSTRPQGARRLGALDGALGDEFQSTRPQGARLRQSSAMIFVVCFNPRARKGRDRRTMQLRPMCCSFNPRARKGRDRRAVGRGHRQLVSIHAPARGATEISLDDVYPDEFQSTRPQGARPALAAKRAAGSKCFNPRARKGRDQGGRRGREAHGVSIHAPARGATGHGRGHGPVQVVSIHAPARGATNIAKTVEQRIKVSIHAPARGATLRSRSTPHRRHVSIHAPARGATAGEALFMAPGVFQSTRPQGARRSESPSSPAPTRFNPRARKGRDYRVKNLFTRIMVSIHAPARGATSEETHGKVMHGMFQSTRPQGARPRVCDLGMHFEHVSIHAPARGATDVSYFIEHVVSVSIHAPARGATPFQIRSARQLGVSIHAPARGATIEQSDTDEYYPRFNPRARKGRDIDISLPVRYVDVSIHAPARGATTEIENCKSQSLFQSTRPQGARHKQTIVERRSEIVSIHAPARGATFFSLRRCRVTEVSIHAPARGATHPSSVVKVP